MPYIDSESGRWVDGIWMSAGSRANQIEEVDSGGWVSDTGFRFKKAGIVKPELPAAVYAFEKTDHGMFFEKKAFPTDNAVSLPGLPCEYILGQIKKFWSRKEAYREHGLLHKRGIMLYGSPGCGKTSIIKLLCNDVLDAGGVVFPIKDFQEAAAFVNEFRSVEPDRPILTIQEDIEGFFDGSAGADQLKAALSFLDGENQTNNVVHLATTNEPEKLADRFIKRPGRFDLVIGIHAPEAETREAYLRHIDPKLPEPLLKEMVEKTHGLSLAYLRELISTYVCLEIPLDETIQRLKADSKKRVLKNPTEKSAVRFGFTVGYEA